MSTSAAGEHLHTRRLIGVLLTTQLVLLPGCDWASGSLLDYIDLAADDDGVVAGEDDDSAGGEGSSSCAGCQSSLSGAAGATALWLVPLLGLRRRRNEALR